MSKSIDITPRHEFVLTKHRTFRKVVKFKRADGTYRSIDDLTFTLYVQPYPAGDLLTIEDPGTDDLHLRVDTTDKSVTIEFTADAVDDFDWARADYRFQESGDESGDEIPRFFGVLRFERDFRA